MNWKVRIKNKTFWLALIPALLIFVNAVLNCFGITVNFESVQANLIAVIEAVFTLLAILGIVVDPTTVGIGDSELALSYDEPAESTVAIREDEDLM